MPQYGPATFKMCAKIINILEYLKSFVANMLGWLWPSNLGSCRSSWSQVRGVPKTSQRTDVQLCYNSYLLKAFNNYCKAFHHRSLQGFWATLMQMFYRMHVLKKMRPTDLLQKDAIGGVFWCVSRIFPEQRFYRTPPDTLKILVTHFSYNEKWWKRKKQL